MSDGGRESDAEDFFDNAPCGLAVAELDGRLTNVNSTLVRWLGRPRE
ncbi:MAG: hypothetical protein K0R68_1290, partial [Mycobacterium sp.]|nr:hypothetical protein [Mycobacterium sp.]